MTLNKDSDVLKNTKHTVLPQDEKVSSPERPGNIRYLMAILLFLAATVCYITRVNMSIALVAMTSNDTSGEHFDWDSKVQNIILSSFFWGYAVTPIPGGLVAQRVGPKSVLLTGIFINSLVVLLTPIAATALGWGAVCVIRVVQGLLQGVLFPCLYGLLAKWAPSAEKGIIMAIVLTGNNAGTIVAFPLGGFLANSDAGWPSIFYIMGATGFVWCLAFIFLGANQPSEHRWISEEEKKYIESSLGNGDVKRQFRTPWKYILTSPPLWALLIAHCTAAFGFWTLLTQIPAYMKNILHFDIRSNGMLSALPYLTMMVLTFICGGLADKLISNGCMTVNFSRKLFNSIGFYGSALFLVILAYTPPEYATVAVSLLIIAVGIYAGAHSGFMMNHIDLTPNYCSPMLGFTNSVSTCWSIMAPLAVGFIVTEEDSPEQWRIIFWITAVLYIIGNTLFLWFGRTDVQPWNDPDYKKSKTTDLVM